MKTIVLIDIPEDNSLEILSPFNTKVTLDYGDKVFELNGDIREVPERDLSFVRNNAYHYQRGWNACVYKILGE